MKKETIIQIETISINAGIAFSIAMIVLVLVLSLFKYVAII